MAVTGKGPYDPQNIFAKFCVGKSRANLFLKTNGFWRSRTSHPKPPCMC